MSLYGFGYDSKHMVLRRIQEHGTQKQYDNAVLRYKMAEQARVFHELVTAREAGENISIGTAIRRVAGRR